MPELIEAILIGAGGMLAGCTFGLAVFVGIDNMPALFGGEPLKDATGEYWEGTPWEDPDRPGRRRFERASSAFVLASVVLLALAGVVLVVQALSA